MIAQRICIPAALSVCFYVLPAGATETVTYTYDALARVIQVVHAGTVNNGQQTTYKHDAAGNRQNTTTTGAASP